jgi:hypothetical protein
MAEFHISRKGISESDSRQCQYLGSKGLRVVASNATIEHGVTSPPSSNITSVGFKHRSYDRISISLARPDINLSRQQALKKETTMPGGLKTQAKA